VSPISLDVGRGGAGVVKIRKKGVDTVVNQGDMLAGETCEGGRAIPILHGEDGPL